MTNTKFRKRALLSSVAMLLVALVALGSATFAWFTQTPTAYADKFSAKTTVNPSLRVQSTSDAALNASAHGFQSTTYFNAAAGASATSKGDVSLEPASWMRTFNSSTKAPNFLKATAAQDSASDLDQGKAIEATTTAIWSERIYFQTASGIEKGQTNQTAAPVYLRGIEWQLNEAAEAAMADEVYVILSKSDGTLIGQYGKTGAQSYLKATKTAAAAYNASTHKGSSPATGTGATIAKGTFSGSSAPQVATAYFKNKDKLTYSSSAAYNVTEADLDFVTVTFYLDGEAADVFSNNVKGVNAGTLIQDFKLTFDLEQGS